MATIEARKLRGKTMISNGDYIVAKKELDVLAHGLTRSIYKVVGESGTSIVVENIHNKSKPKPIPRDFFRSVSKNMIEVSMKKRLGQIESDKAAIARVLDKIEGNFDKAAAKTIKDLLEYDEDIKEEDIVAAISGSLAMDSFMNEIASISNLEID